MADRLSAAAKNLIFSINPISPSRASTTTSFDYMNDFIDQFESLNRPEKEPWPRRRRRPTAPNV